MKKKLCCFLILLISAGHILHAQSTAKNNSIADLAQAIDLNTRTADSLAVQIIHSIEADTSKNFAFYVESLRLLGKIDSPIGINYLLKHIANELPLNKEGYIRDPFIISHSYLFALQGNRNKWALLYQLLSFLKTEEITDKMADFYISLFQNNPQMNDSVFETVLQNELTHISTPDGIIYSGSKTYYNNIKKILKALER